MKRYLPTIAAAAALLAGCEHNTSPAKSSTTSADAMKSTSSDSAKMSSSAAKPTMAPAPSAKEYYEVNKNGKTYVFGKLDDVLAFRSSGALPANTTEKPAFGPNGETVVFQTGGMEQGLMAEYQKAHPKK